jgi:hypothetical protein
MTKHIAPWIVFSLFLAAVGAAPFDAPVRSRSGIDLQDFRRLPVSVSGRVQPLDTVARLALNRIRGSESVAVDPGPAGRRATDSRLGADEWLLEVLATPDVADTRRIFPIATKQALEKLALKPSPADGCFAFRDLAGQVDTISREAVRIAKVKVDDRAPWEREIVGVRDKLVIYERLKNSLQPNSALQRQAKGNGITFDFTQALGKYRTDLSEAVRLAEGRRQGKTETLDPATEQRIRAFASAFQAVSRVGLVAAVPPHEGEPRNRWSNAGTEIANSARGGTLSPATGYLAKIASAFARSDGPAFTRASAGYRAWMSSNGLRREVNRAAIEVFYNDLQPMLRSIPVYAIGLLLVFAAGRRLARATYLSAALLIALAMALHTAGIAFAFVLAGRPSVLVFAGWAIALCGLVIEWFSRRGLGLAVAGISAVAALGATYGLAPGAASLFVRQATDLRLVAAAVASAVVLLAANHVEARKRVADVMAELRLGPPLRRTAERV